MDSDVEVADYEGRPLVFVHVPRADRHLRPVFVNNNPKTGTYRRNGEGDYHVTSDVYLSLVRDSMSESIDRVLLEEFSLEDFNAETVRAYRDSFRAARPDHPWVGLDDTSFLMRVGAAGRSENDHLIHPTRAGLLMFGEAWRIVDEFPQYFLDCRQVLDDGNRWNNRVVSSSGDWTGNVFDFWHKAYRMLSEGLPVPFRLAPDMRRVDVTPQHRAVREALTNALVHADYFGRTGVVVIREPGRVITRNPGTLRIGLDEVEAGGVSDPRNETLLSMFSFVNIGERAGSGFDVLREGTRSARKPDPVLEELWEPDRVLLTLELETSGLAEFDLPGMEGERSRPLIEGKLAKGTHSTDHVASDGNADRAGSDPVGDHVIQSTDPVADQVTQSSDPVENLLAVLGDREMSIGELMQELGLEHRTNFRRNYLDPALEQGLIERTVPDKPTSSKQRYRKTK